MISHRIWDISNRISESTLQFLDDNDDDDNDDEVYDDNYVQDKYLGGLRILKCSLFTTYNEMSDIIITIFANEKTEDQQD